MISRELQALLHSTSTQTSILCFYNQIQHQLFIHWIWKSSKISKLWYRKLLFCYVLSKTDTCTCTSASEVTNHSQSCWLLKHGSKCFERLVSSLRLFKLQVQPLRISEDSDPFLDINENDEDDDDTELSSRN